MQRGDRGRRQGRRRSTHARCPVLTAAITSPHWARQEVRRAGTSVIKARTFELLINGVCSVHHAGREYVCLITQE